MDPSLASYALVGAQYDKTPQSATDYVEPEVPAQEKKAKPEISSVATKSSIDDGVLGTWLIDHIFDPYYDDATRQQLMDATSLSRSQVDNWFRNTRRRMKTFYAGKLKELMEMYTDPTVRGGLKFAWIRVMNMISATFAKESPAFGTMTMEDKKHVLAIIDAMRQSQAGEIPVSPRELQFMEANAPKRKPKPSQGREVKLKGARWSVQNQTQPQHESFKQTTPVRTSTLPLEQPLHHAKQGWKPQVTEQQCVTAGKQEFGMVTMGITMPGHSKGQPIQHYSPPHGQPLALHAPPVDVHTSMANGSLLGETHTQSLSMSEEPGLAIGSMVDVAMPDTVTSPEVPNVVELDAQFGMTDFPLFPCGFDSFMLGQ
ncbi:Homeobox KN domain [Carpediemonas membranifera]|uniref:Homeobox KN domain n=1 Tax=Carpediemonas membranifera TaxID=201153 RepID=A0A8J6AWL6_9EUKA|nr:Homeobox KN domain [Carpediemonas membranifera]|eukprot:KAG9395998.1 Homeobox KN domain [Carpediemonas membranifera]